MGFGRSPSPSRPAGSAEPACRPTRGWLDSGQTFTRLTPTEQAAFLLAVQHFVDHLQAPRGLRNGLRVKGIQGASGIFEMTWASDGRATFEYGPEAADREPHVIWRRVGTHAV